MSIQKLDIWNNWHRGMTLAFRDGNPVADGYITLCADEQAGRGCGGHGGSGHECGCGGHGDDGCGCGGHDHSGGGGCDCGSDESCGCGDGCDCGGHDDDGHECGCGGHEDDGDSALHDTLINMLYFAAFRAHCGVHVSGLGDDFSVSADELASVSDDIDYLSHVFGYKTNQLSLDQFIRELSERTVYYSTLAGENGEGEPVFFSCTSGGDVDFYPVFLTEAHLREFFEAYNRPQYVIMQNSFAEFLSVLDSNEQLQKMGAVIEPMLGCAVGLPPGIRV